MKKILLPLILVLFLTFILIGNCAWLDGWDQRIQLTIGDYAGDIGAEVTWFPVTVFLTSTQGEEVFAEFDADTDYIKVAFTKADGTTELYAECELFDDSASLGIYHVSRTGWVINANTSVYMYYDNDHADNSTYIGYQNTAAAEAVWDASFAAVYHMRDGASTAAIYDSTSNNIDGAKFSANNPIEANVKVGKGQDFSTDWIDCTLGAGIDTSTFELFVRMDSLGGSTWPRMIQPEHDYLYFDGTDNSILYRAKWSVDGVWVTDTGTTIAGADYWIATTYDGSSTAGDPVIWINNTSVNVTEVTPPQTTRYDSAGTMTIGDRPGHDRDIDGQLDEIRFSSVIRATAWLNGTYNSVYDILFTYGSKETPFPLVKWNGVVITKWNTKEIVKWNTIE